MKNYTTIFHVIVKLEGKKPTQPIEQVSIEDIDLDDLQECCKEETREEWLTYEELIMVIATSPWLKIEILDHKEVTITDEDEILELQRKLNNVRDFFDNVSSHIDDCKSSLSDLEYYLDEAQEDVDFGIDECYYE